MNNAHTTAATIPEAARYRAAWSARRRRYWIYYGLLLGLLAVTFGTMAVPHRLPVSPIAVGVFCIMGMLFATMWLYQFRCPRCGKVFWSQWAQKPRIVETGPQACEHCGLKTNEIPGETQP